MTTITAAIILARYNYESTDFDPNTDETTSLTNVEYIIDDVIDYINLEAETSISNLAGTAGTKTVTVTSSQNAAIKLILPLMLRDAKYKINNSSGLGPASVSETVYMQDPMFKRMFEKALNRLRGSSFERV